MRAFLKGRFWELLNTSFDVTNHPHLPQNETHYSPDSPPSTRSLRSRALEVLDLVRLGELSRDHGLTFNQALQVFNHWEWLNTCYRYRCPTMVEHHTVQPLFNHCSTVQPLFNP